MKQIEKMRGERTRHVKYVVDVEKKFLIEKVVKQTRSLLPCRSMLMKQTISQTRRTNHYMSTQ